MSTMMTSLLMRHGMQRKKNRAELFGELVMSEHDQVAQLRDQVWRA